MATSNRCAWCERPGASSGVTAATSPRCSSCIGRAGTTGRSPRASWSRGEKPIAAAVREVEEETGLRVWLGPRLRDDHYTISQRPAEGRLLLVRPAAAQGRHHRATSPTPRSTRSQWISLSKARETLTYPRDVELLDELTASRRSTRRSLLIVRHAEARKRKTWRGDDTERPLTAAGRRTAERLAPVFARVRRSRGSSRATPLRCVETMLPYVNAVRRQVAAGRRPVGGARDQEGAGASRRPGRSQSDKRMAICTHRPVLPASVRRAGHRRRSRSTRAA